MSWINVSSNQEVTLNNLQDAVNTGVFTAKASIPASQKLMTKAEADAYVYINTNYPPYLAKISNQLVVKGDLQSNPPTSTTTTTAIPPLYSGRIYGVDDYSTNIFATPTYGNLIYSDNGGLSWASTTVGTFYCARNNTGQYVLVGYNTIKVSNDYGATFTETSLPSEPYAGLVTGVAMSDSGQYMVIITYGGNVTDPLIYKSTNYGVTWSLAYQYTLGQFFRVEQTPYPKIDISGNGQYITAVFGRSESFAWGAIKLSSSNYGASFTQFYNSDIYISDIAVSNTGKYQLYTRFSSYGTGNEFGEGAIHASDNFGSSFILKKYEKNFRALYCAMSASGQYMLTVFSSENNTSNKFYYSTNFGSSWLGFDTNPTPPLKGPTPGGAYIAPDGSYGLITYVGSSQITYTTDFVGWSTVVIFPQTYKFGGLNKSK